MRTLTELRVGSATHAGGQRERNEDRMLVDTANGIFAVADGVGGHAAGEVAAEAAIECIHKALLAASDEAPEAAIRRAVTEANNRVLAMSVENPAWRGMACVLTVALIREGWLSWGHVGDSRLYLLMGGDLRKLTRDHSPVGEQEDSGALEESEAMAHPLRNEIFRDVGSVARRMDDQAFVETGSLEFRLDAALLLCSDGLSDALTSAEIAATLQAFQGDAEATARQLMDAANEQSGGDNVTVILAAGAEFAGRADLPKQDNVTRHAITRVRLSEGRAGGVERWWWMLLGIFLGALSAIAWERRFDLARSVSTFMKFR